MGSRVRRSHPSASSSSASVGSASGLRPSFERAAQVGANGIIVNDVSQNKTGVNVLGEAVGAKTATARASGLAIWMPAGADRTRLACGTSG